MKLLIQQWIVLTLFFVSVRGQTQGPIISFISSVFNPPATTTAQPPAATTSAAVPTSSALPVSSVAPVSSSIVLSSAVSSTRRSSSTLPRTSATAIISTASSVSDLSSIPSSSATSPVPTQKTEPKEGGDTAAIVGGVVGGIVGIALIGGVIACVSRRGGCTKRSDKKKSEFEDYGLGDFPHHRPVTAAPVKPLSPTIPRLNDQGNYYDGYNYNQQPTYVDNSIDYNMQQQPYYYPDQQQQPYYYPDQQQPYYDNNGYVYDNSTAYSTLPPPPPVMQYSPVPQTVHKPDEAPPPPPPSKNV